jgi:hypothetical protein
MRILGTLGARLEDIGRRFTVEVFGREVQPMIEDALRKHGKQRQRNRKLGPVLTVWLILGLCLRREISYKNVLSWLLSGLRSRGLRGPRNPVAQGAITRGRRRIGVDVVRSLFYGTALKAAELAPDFYGLLSLAFDGTTMTMADTAQNSQRFGRPGTGREKAAFPQARVVAMVATAVHAVYDIAIGPFVGKGTGEPTLARELILKNARPGILCLLDKGFYGFQLLHSIVGRGAHFIVAVRSGVNLKPIPKTRGLDGSYLSWVVGEFEHPAGPLPDGRKRWLKTRLLVRVVEYHIPGFQSRRVATSLLDFEIPACEIARHYHRRWEIELAYDELKTHQCPRRRGQCPTVLRSKLPDLVEQEIYGMFTVYNLLRDLINEAARKHELNPLSISFVDALQAVLDAVPLLAAAPAHRLADLYSQLLDDIAGCRMSQWRRPRAYPRVVKIKLSNFERKKPQHAGEHRDFEAEMQVLGAVA